jgi:copper homeostasis protein
LGLLTLGGRVDVVRTRQLMAAARPLSVTFHRAFDMTAHPFAALADLLDLGVDRLLTSGQKATAWEGRELIQALQERANGRIHIMAGSGLNASNAADLIKATGVHEIHVGSACAEVVPGQIAAGKTAVFDQNWPRVSATRVREIVEAVQK